MKVFSIPSPPFNNHPYIYILSSLLPFTHSHIFKIYIYTNVANIYKTVEGSDVAKQTHQYG